MILSNVAIHQAIDDGIISIEPEPLPRLNSVGNTSSSPYNTTSVDLRLAQDLNVADDQRPLAFDLRKGAGLAQLLRDSYRAVCMDPKGGFTLDPHTFVLGRTVEVVSLNVLEGKRVLAARVEGRSSFARCGLLVHFTAPTIHAGFSGTITLEIINLGMHSIVLYPNMPICQVIFEAVEGTPRSATTSQFHNQRTPAGTAG